MPVVVDASVCASWYLPDEDNEIANRTLDALGSDDGIAPSLFWFEIRNILIICQRRGRLTALQADFALARLNDLQIILDRSPNEAVVIYLARTHRLTIYDAA